LIFFKKKIEEKDLIHGCIAGKRDYQNILYRKYASAMLAICFRYAKDKDEAEDILQDGFIKAFDKLTDYRFDGSFEGWLKRIFVTTALNYYRSNSKMGFKVDFSEIQESYQADEEVVSENSNLSENELMGLIQSLPNGYKMVFNMYVFEDYSHKEIAETLGISENTSKTQLMKARNFLKKGILEKTTLKKELSFG